MVEGSELSYNFSNSISFGDEITFSKNSKCQKRGKGGKVIEFLKAHSTAPTQNILNTSMWLTSEFKFWDTNSTPIKNCIKILNNYINNLSFKEIFLYLKSVEPQNLIFNAPINNLYIYYYSINESIDILEELLKY